jgi:hypothetical protein
MILYRGIPIRFWKICPELAGDSPIRVQILRSRSFAQVTPFHDEILTNIGGCCPTGGFCCGNDCGVPGQFCCGNGACPTGELCCFELGCTVGGGFCCGTQGFSCAAGEVCCPLNAGCCPSGDICCPDDDTCCTPTAENPDCCSD